MSTEKRMPNKKVHETHEMRLEERFVALYEVEVEEIQFMKEDLEKVEKLTEENKNEIEKMARTYNRVFSTHFYEVAQGRVSDEEFLPIWEREDELLAGLKKMQMLEGEKRQLKKEVDIAQDENDQLVEAIERTRIVTSNQKAIFVSFFIMAIVAALLGTVAAFIYQLPVIDHFWKILLVIVIVGLGLFGLWKLQRKSADNVRLYGKMLKQRKNSEGRMGNDYMILEDDLMYYREKYELFFEYITEEQWKLFEFCAKVSSEIKFNEELKKAKEQLEKLLTKYRFQRPVAWTYRPKVLYDVPKRIAFMEELNHRQNTCEQAMVRHRRTLDEYENGEL